MAPASDDRAETRMASTTHSNTTLDAICGGKNTEIDLKHSVTEEQVNYKVSKLAGFPRAWEHKKRFSAVQARNP